MSEGLAEPAELRPASSGERRRPVWVVPDEVPAIVPQSARFTEARWVGRYRRAALAADLGAGVIGGSLALVARFGAQINVGYFLVGALLPIAWLACVALQRGYETRYFGTGPEEFRSIIRAAVALTAVVAITSYATKSEVARGFVVLAVPMTCLAAMTGRWVLHRSISWRRFAGRCMRRVLVVGRNDQVSTLRRHLEERPADGYVVVASCLPRGDAFAEPELELLGRTEMDILAAVDKYDVDVVAVAADPELAGYTLRKLSWALEQRGVELIVSPGIVEVAGPRISIRPVAGLSLLHLERPSVSGGPHLLKSIFDRVVGCLLLLAFAPLMLGVALMIRLTSAGRRCSGRRGSVRRASRSRSTSSGRCTPTRRPTQGRAGQALNERREGVLFKIKNDPRITPSRPDPASLLDRRAAAADQRRSGRHVPGRPTAAAARRGRAVQRSTCGAGCSCGRASRVSGRSVAARTWSGSNQCGSTCAMSTTGRSRWTC